jgi:hypothetical protein
VRLGFLSASSRLPLDFLCRPPARISDQARALDQDFNGLGASPRPVRDFEALAIASYQVQLREGFSLTPNVQYVFHPGGGYVPDETEPVATKDAVVVGVRMTIRFQPVDGRICPSIRPELAISESLCNQFARRAEQTQFDRCPCRRCAFSRRAAFLLRSQPVFESPDPKYRRSAMENTGRLQCKVLSGLEKNRRPQNNGYQWKNNAKNNGEQ